MSKGKNFIWLSFVFLSVTFEVQASRFATAPLLDGIGVSVPKRTYHKTSLPGIVPNRYDPASSPQYIKIVEVGARDGLQNQPHFWTPDERITLLDMLMSAGLRYLEGGSFVSPRAVPKMAGTGQIARHYNADQYSMYHLSYLVPNLKGLGLALDAGAKEIAVFLSATEGFSQANLKTSIAESIKIQRATAEEAIAKGLLVRGYVSCIATDPFFPDELTDPRDVAYVVKALFDMGCYEVSLGDTTGKATPERTDFLLKVLINEYGFPVEKLAAHFHDTDGLAITNIGVSLDRGIKAIDSSIAGLGGCPYAPGAPGNVATEKVVSYLHSRGNETGVDLGRLKHAGKYVQDVNRKKEQEKFQLFEE